MLYLGIDTGGTFTDFVCVDDGEVRVHKVLSTPDAPEQAILEGIRQMGLYGREMIVVHGSTVATNAVLEGKGVKTAYVTNTGFKDVLLIGRQARRQLYNLQPAPEHLPLQTDLCFEVDCRLSADGSWLTEIDTQQLQQLASEIVRSQARSVAVNLLFSYLDDSAEKTIRSHLPDDLFISLSSEVLAEIGEYERGMATWLNAWVGPMIQGYIKRLQAGLGDISLAIMQSSGETLAAEQASAQAVRLLLSGPAAGLVGAGFMAARSGFQRVMTFDMGGTSSDVALIDGQINLTNRGRIDRYPVAVPMVDMHTIGAGGGSIAYLDEGGMLQVGPESAGAFPGPVCYGRGGAKVTVTDANLVLGYIPEDSLLGGYMPLRKDLAEEVVSTLAVAMSVTPLQAAQGVIDIANEHMARALRVISVQKGYNPADFTLVSFGGSGGLHACALASRLNMSRVLVPGHAGVLSALGMLASPPGRQLSKTLTIKLSETVDEQIEEELAQLRQAGVSQLLAEGLDEQQLASAFLLDLRYYGQSNALTVEWQGRHASESRFHRLHEQRYGHRLDLPVELVNLRVRVTGPQRLEDLPVIDMQPIEAASSTGTGIPVYQRSALQPGQRLAGPAIISEAVATIWVEQGWCCLCEDNANLLLEKIGVAQAIPPYPSRHENLHGCCSGKSH